MEAERRREECVAAAQHFLVFCLLVVVVVMLLRKRSEQPHPQDEKASVLSTSDPAAPRHVLPVKTSL